MRAPKRDFLTLGDLRADEILLVLDHAGAMKNQRATGGRRKTLEGRSVAMIFEKPSTRTRVSFEIAVYELGGHPVVLSGREMQLGRGESVEDTARTLSGYVHAIVMRTHAHERIRTMARAASVPVINALSDEAHPCQVLADLQTVRELRGKLKGLKYAWVGDGNNVARSWAEAAWVLGLNLVMACPDGYAPPAGTLPEDIRVVREPSEAVADADVVITDVWTSMGHEDEGAARRDALRRYAVDPGLMAMAHPRALVLHCLPAHRGEEIAAEYLDGPASAVWIEAENRLHSQKSLLDFLLRDKPASLRPPA